MSQYENLQLKNQLCFALYAATNAITKAYRLSLSQVGLTYPQYLVMMVLWNNDGATVTDIAKQIQVDSSTITPLLKRLELTGFISRNRNKSDERIVNIFLTENGLKIQAEVAILQKNVACQTGLPEEQFIELRSTLFALIDNLSVIQPALESTA